MCSRCLGLGLALPLIWNILPLLRIVWGWGGKWGEGELRDRSTWRGLGSPGALSASQLSSAFLTPPFSKSQAEAGPCLPLGTVPSELSAGAGTAHTGKSPQDFQATNPCAGPGQVLWEKERRLKHAADETDSFHTEAERDIRIPSPFVLSTKEGLYALIFSICS